MYVVEPRWDLIRDPSSAGYACRSLLWAGQQVKRYQMYYGTRRAYASILNLVIRSSIVRSRKSLLNSHNFLTETYHPSTSSFLFPNASVKEDIIFRPTAAAAFTADRSSLSTSDETIPGFIAQWTARCYENRVLWYLLTVLTYQSHVTSLWQHSN